MTAKKFLTHDDAGIVTGPGYTPDGTIPAHGIECTPEQALAWQGSTVVDGAIVAPPPPTTDQLAATARAERNARLTASDWSQGRDVPDSVASKWTQYRQALRDLTKQAGFPESITWPVAP